MLAVVAFECHAYIDPNVGGWLFQMLLPLLIAIAAAWTFVHQRIRAFFSRFFRRRDKPR
jgi:hypothetical protein